MKSKMLIKPSGVLLLVTILFCFDSLLKIPIGSNYLHISIVVLLIYFVVRYFAYPTSAIVYIKALSSDKPLVLMLCLSLMHVYSALDLSVYLVTVSYLLAFALVYVFICSLPRQMDYERIAKAAVIILIATGIFQYILINAFSYQIELRDISVAYYEDKGTLGTRMRGFYLEPNWYGLSLFAWTYLLIRSENIAKWNRVMLIPLAAACLILSNNRLVLALLGFLLIARVISRRSEGGLYVYSVIFLLASIGLYGYFSLADVAFADRSAAARFFTAGNVFARWVDSEWVIKVFGNGLSNWGAYSNEFGFSASNYLMDQALTRRDNAEVYVFLFEMGVMSFLIFVFDIISSASRANRGLDFAFMSTIYVAALFYPIYQFMFYLIPYAIVRSIIYQQSSPERVKIVVA